MSIVKYTIDRKFNIAQALKDGWNVDWAGEGSLVGINLQDRRNKNHKVSINGSYWFMGILMVSYKEGGYQCLDHSIAQYKRIYKNKRFQNGQNTNIRMAGKKSVPKVSNI